MAPLNSSFGSEMPDLSGFSQLLSKYGIAMPQPRQNVILPEPGSDNFFGRHPMLSRGIENALLGVAAMGPTPEVSGAGDNISRAIQGFLGGPQLRTQMQMAPFMQSLGLAKTAADLQHVSDEHDYMQAHGEYMRAHGQYFLNGGRAPGEKDLYDHFVDVPDEKNPNVKKRWGFNRKTSQYELVPGLPSQVGRSKTLAERMVDADEQSQIENGGEAFSAEERNSRLMHIFTTQAQASGFGRGMGQNEVPGSVTPADRFAMETQRGNLVARQKQLGESFVQFQMDNLGTPMTEEQWNGERNSVQQQLPDLSNPMTPPARRAKGKLKVSPNKARTPRFNPATGNFE